MSRSATAIGFSADDSKLVAVDIGFIREFTLAASTVTQRGASCGAPAAFFDSQGEPFLLKREGRGTLISSAEVKTGLFEAYEMIGCLSVEPSENIVTFGLIGAGKAPGNKGQPALSE